jgi:hypothetical protein
MGNGLRNVGGLSVPIADVVVAQMADLASRALQAICRQPLHLFLRYPRNVVQYSAFPNFDTVFNNRHLEWSYVFTEAFRGGRLDPHILVDVLYFVSHDGILSIIGIICDCVMRVGRSMCKNGGPNALT